MGKRNLIKSLRTSLSICALCSIATTGHAAYISATLGNAVLSDASAAYYNPAALTLVPNPQLVIGAAEVYTSTQASGTATKIAIRNSQTGTASSNVSYFLPQAFFAAPLTPRITFGVGELYNYYGVTSYPTDSVVRYMQTYSEFKSLDLTPALSFKIADSFSVGAGLDFQDANLQLDSVYGFPTVPALHSPDTKWENGGEDVGTGWHAGLLWMPLRGTQVGLAYHSSIDYTLRGKSNFCSSTPVISNSFSTKVTQPQNFLFTVNQYVNEKLGFLATVERDYWDSVDTLNLKNMAFLFHGVPITLSNTPVVFDLDNTWRFTLGSHYQIDPKWKVRGSLTYDEEPGNPEKQVVLGDDIIAAAGVGYQVNKIVGLDLGYGHTFYRGQNVNAATSTNTFVGSTSGRRDAIAAKMIINFV